MAVKKVLATIPADFILPIAAVIHRASSSGKDVFSSALQQENSVEVVEVEDKMTICKGYCYIAPPDYHLLVDDGHFALSSAERVSYARPSIDVLFETAADYFQKGLIAILLTGNNSDGSKGLQTVKEKGGTVIIQDPQEAEAPMMPSSAINKVDPDYVLDLEGIAEFLRKLESSGK